MAANRPNLTAEDHSDGAAMNCQRKPKFAATKMIEFLGCYCIEICIASNFATIRQHYPSTNILQREDQSPIIILCLAAMYRGQCIAAIMCGNNYRRDGGKGSLDWRLLDIIQTLIYSCR